MMCYVERNGWVGRSDHPYKASALLKAKGVPTVLVIDGGDNVVMRAETDADFQDRSLLEMIGQTE